MRPPTAHTSNEAFELTRRRRDVDRRNREGLVSTGGRGQARRTAILTVGIRVVVVIAMSMLIEAR